MALSLAELTEPQRKAATHVEGPLLILAGPGSGKTRVVTHRIANLLQSGIPSHHILALTFTNKAADEMNRRVAQLAPSESVWISTFHRFCSRLLREYAPLIGLRENFTIYDRTDSERALRLALEGLEDLNLDKITPARLLSAISNCKNELITAEDYVPHGTNTTAVLLKEIYPAYQRQLTMANAMDFDDLLLHVVALLKQNESLRSELDERYRYVMVDEYQDTNLAQYAIARALSIDYPNLAVTGDPDQSIYSWRGANIRNILGFEQDYPHVTVVRLEQNFRSTPEILSVADTLIRANQQRKKKSLIAVRGSSRPVALHVFPGQLDESRYIAQEITKLVVSGQREYRDIAIFYRINTLSRYLEHTLREHDVPYQVLNGVEFYQRKEIKDIVAYLQLINNPSDDIAFLRIINTPPRGIGKTTQTKIADLARDRRCAMLEASRHICDSLPKRSASGLKRFLDMMELFSAQATARAEAILGYVLSHSGYEEFVRETDDRADEDRCANIRELLSAARQFDMLHRGTDYLEAFLEQTSLVSDTDAWEDESNKVTLMTLHGAKGLEFPVVFMVAMEQGKLPHDRSLEDPQQLEEERRLMFVGITRARDLLTLSYAKYRDYRGRLAPTVASSFLMELPRSEMQVTAPITEVLENYPAEWDDLDDGAMDFDPADLEDELNASTVDTDRGASEIFSNLTTAAALVGEQELPQSERSVEDRPDPNVFVQGMRVSHPEFGLGKIIALSGDGKARTATVNFVTNGVQTFVLAYSPLRPLH